MILKKLFISGCIFLLIISAENIDAQDYSYFSPDGKLELIVNTDEGIKWSLKYKGERVILPSSFKMEFATRTIPDSEYRIKSFEPESVEETYTPVVAHKNSVINDQHTQISLEFRKNYKIVFRLYDDGLAYRFETDFKQNMIVINEKSIINFIPGSKVWYPLEEGFMSHNERTYIESDIDTLNEKHLASLPLLVKTGETNILLTETALENYPGMWVRGLGKGALASVFPAYPREEKLYRDRDMRVIKRSDFIAETRGQRAYPWRVFLVTDRDAGLIESNLTWLLSDTCRLEETDWIKPGKVAWDWWNANNIYGVDFKAGINTETYKYYIDFASENGLEYIILDEGWYRLGDVLDVAEDMDIKEICDYGKSKNVGVILWVVWETLDRKLDQALIQYQNWGVKGLKVDFMQRDDQKMVEYYYRIAKKAAEYKLLVDFHGSYKPSGLRRTYPNVLTREGVKGLEHCKWSKDITPDHNLTIPFIRMVAGPMDYTPGAMINLEQQNFNPMFSRPASQGSRVHQMALYIAYESPLQMMADNPSNYRKEQECTDFIADIPVVWDETRVLEAKTGDYLVVARRSGNTWYMGGMTDGEGRAFDLDLSFIGEGDYQVTLFEDGINADAYAQDYKRSERTINLQQLLHIEMAPGGGWIARIVNNDK